MRAARIAVAAGVLAASFGAGAILFDGAPGKPEYNPLELKKARYMEALMAGGNDIGGPFALTGADGARRSLEDWRGKLVLLYFGYMRCPDVCPGDLIAVKQLMERLGTRAGEVQPVFVTIDPERDTREQLGPWLALIDRRIAGLTGSVSEIRAVADRYRAYFEKAPFKGSAEYLMDHSANSYLIDRAGKYAGYFPPGTSAERMLDVLQDHL